MVGLAVLLVAYFLTYIVFIQPLYLPKFGSYGLHFASLGGDKSEPGRAVGSGRDMLLALASHPLAVLRLFASWERLGYVLRLLWPVGFVALLAPRALAGALPILAINFLSSFPRVRTIESHYTTAMVPFIMAAALIGAGGCAFSAGQRAFWQGLAGALRTDLWPRARARAVRAGRGRRISFTAARRWRSAARASPGPTSATRPTPRRCARRSPGLARGFGCRAPGSARPPLPATARHQPAGVRRRPAGGRGPDTRRRPDPQPHRRRADKK